VQNAKFVGTLYILGDVLPILSELSLTFQSGYLNFSQVGPSIEIAKLRLSKVLEDKNPLEKLERDIDSLTAMSPELTFPRNVYDQLEGLLRKYFRTSKIVLMKGSKHCKHSPSLTHAMSQRKTSLVF